MRKETKENNKKYFSYKEVYKALSPDSKTKEEILKEFGISKDNNYLLLMYTSNKCLYGCIMQDKKTASGIDFYINQDSDFWNLYFGL